MIRFLQGGNRAVKLVLSAFLLVVCFSMVAYLIPGITTGGADLRDAGVVATVGGEEIRTADLNKLVSQIQQQQKFPDSLRPLLVPRALQQLTEAAEIRYEAQRLGLSATDEEVKDELHNPPYKNLFFPEGKWVGQQKYEEMLSQGGLTVHDFEQELRTQVVARKLFGAVAAGATVSPAEIEKLYKEQNTRVKFDYAVLKQEDLKKTIKFSDAELKAYFDSNKSGYLNSIPEKRQLRYFVISDKDVQSKASVTPAEVQQEYNAHQDRYRVPDEIKTRHILVKTPSAGPDGKVDQKAVDAARAKAEGLLKQVRSGADFAELAKKNSDDPGSAAQGGELGWFKKGTLVPEYEKAAYGQEKGQISGLVQTTYGFHIIQTEDKHVAGVKPFAEVRDSIETGLKQQKTGEVLNQMVSDAQNIAKDQGLEKAAAKYNASVVNSNPISRRDTLPGIGAAPEVTAGIFSGNEKSGPQVTRFAQGYVIFQVTKIEPARTPSLDEVREKVSNDFKTSRSAVLLQQRLQEMADRAHAEHDLHKAAKEAGATVKTSDLVGPNDSSVPDIGSMTGQARVAFTMKPGEISGPLSGAGDGFVVAIVDRQEANTGDEKYAKEKDRLREQIVGQKRQQALELFVANLKTRLEKEGKEKTNKAAMDLLTRGRG
ncbi:MAG TPA: peptidylprolyl isomerase [Candidatus Angelobacter sp.]|nr:peptidylprolyl isomerase [Candidatus Angelobacter sp.]